MSCLRALRPGIIALGLGAGCGSYGGGTYYPPGFVADLQTASTTTGGNDLGRASAPDLSQDNPPAPDLAFAPPDLRRSVDLAIVSTNCSTGNYGGALTAHVTVATRMFNLSGTANLTLGAPVGGIYPILQGSMEGSDPVTGASATADVTGALDCTQGVLVNGVLVNGTASYMTLSLPFAGTIAADYDPTLQRFTHGTLMTTGVAGSGSWSASLIP